MNNKNNRMLTNNKKNKKDKKTKTKSIHEELQEALDQSAADAREWLDRSDVLRECAIRAMLIKNEQAMDVLECANEIQSDVVLSYNRLIARRILIKYNAQLERLFAKNFTCSVRRVIKILLCSEFVDLVCQKESMPDKHSIECFCRWHVECYNFKV